jgi:hypothetical protein
MLTALESKDVSWAIVCYGMFSERGGPSELYPQLFAYLQEWKVSALPTGLPCELRERPND